MATDNKYLLEFEKLVKNNSLSHKYPIDYIDRWDEFVKDCSEGYKDSLYDYDHEISIRKQIEVILNSNNLKQFQDFKIFKKRIRLIDKEFKRLLNPTLKLPYISKYWWEIGVLKYSGKEFAENLKREFNLNIKVKE